MKSIFFSKIVFIVCLFAIFINGLNSKAQDVEKYTLTDDDVEVENGMIVSCSYDCAIKYIVFPDSLDGQLVTGIDFGDVFLSPFRDKDLIGVDLPSGLKHIGRYTFYMNDITHIDLPESIITLEYGAFDFGFGGLRNLTLPIPSEPGFLFWLRNETETIEGGTTVETSIHDGYFAIFEYTLTDEDVVVNNGIIDSCTYDLIATYITIPKTLDGQTIIGISDAVYIEDKYEYVGPFVEKDIRQITLPSTLEYIGKNSFRSNLITSLSIPGNVNCINDYAFNDNILDTVIFEAPSKLKAIGFASFDNNSNLLKENCDIVLPEPDYSIFEGWYEVPGIKHEAKDTIKPEYPAYYAKVPYTLQTGDVIIEDGIITECLYNFNSKFIIIPNEIDDQIITGIADAKDDNLLFSQQRLMEVTFSQNLQKIGEKSFSANFINQISFEENSNLKRIEYAAFWRNQLDSLNFPASLEYIGQNAFDNNGNLNYVRFEDNTQINTIDYNAFKNTGVDLKIQLPTPSKIGYSFKNWKDDNGHIYDQGEAITDLDLQYTAIFEVDESALIISVSGDIDFGETEQNASAVKKIMVSNDGTNTLTVESIDLPEGFIANWTNGEILSDENKEIDITFSPSEIKTYEGDIIIHSNATSGTSSLSVKGIGIEGSSSIKSINTNSFYIYPNPSTGLILLSSKLSENALIEVSNLTGKIILRKTVNELSYKIDLTSQSGLYIVKISESNTTIIQKLIVK